MTGIKWWHWPLSPADVPQIGAFSFGWFCLWRCTSLHSVWANWPLKRWPHGSAGKTSRWRLWQRIDEPGECRCWYRCAGAVSTRSAGPYPNISNTNLLLWYGILSSHVSFLVSLRSKSTCAFINKRFMSAHRFSESHRNDLDTSCDCWN